MGVIGLVGLPSRTKPSEEGRASKGECVSMKVDLGPSPENLNSIIGMGEDQQQKQVGEPTSTPGMIGVEVMHTSS